MKNYFTTNKGKAIFLIEKGYELLAIEKSEKGKLKFLFDFEEEIKQDVKRYSEANSILNIKIKDFIK